MQTVSQILRRRRIVCLYPLSNFRSFLLPSIKVAIWINTVPTEPAAY